MIARQHNDIIIFDIDMNLQGPGMYLCIADLSIKVSSLYYCSLLNLMVQNCGSLCGSPAASCVVLFHIFDEVNLLGVSRSGRTTGEVTSSAERERDRKKHEY